jgi:hypothetical protein
MNQQLRKNHKRTSDRVLCTPLESQGIIQPVANLRGLRYPIFVTGRMQWADDETLLALATLESLRRLLADDSSRLVMISELVREVAVMLAPARVDSSQVVEIIAGWKVFPASLLAVECTPRRIAAVIKQYREFGRLQARTSRFLSVLGTTDFVDKITDPEDEW